AIPSPARTNGSANPEPPAPLLVEPAPERSADKAITLADQDLTTAQKVCALASGACRWPCGDPGRPDFHFCGNPVVEPPYCAHHRTMPSTPPRPPGRHPP